MSMEEDGGVSGDHEDYTLQSREAMPEEAAATGAGHHMRVGTGAPRPAPSFRTVERVVDSPEDDPGPRCSHTLTAIAAVGEENTPTYVGPRLILFGGATAIEDGSGAASPTQSIAGGGGIRATAFEDHSGAASPTQSVTGGGAIRLAGVTNNVHCYYVDSNKWTRLHPSGEPPSPRAAHVATTVGTMVVIQGGIGPAGHATEDLHVLDMSHTRPKWHRVVVQGPGPGPRYGHVMALVAQRYIVIIGGSDGKRSLSDIWALDTAAKPYEWRKLEPKGEGPHCCMYSTASARSDGLLLVCGGRDRSALPISDAYGLVKHRDGRWEWVVAPGVVPSPRYQHASAFVNSRLHISGGVVRGGKMVEGATSAAVLDTSASVWLDRNGVVTSPSPRISRTGSDAARGEGAVELTRRCRHAATSVDCRIFLYGGLRGEFLLDDLLVAEDVATEVEPTVDGNGQMATDRNADREITLEAPDVASENGAVPLEASSPRLQRSRSIELLVEQSSAEANAITAALEAAQAAESTVDGHEQPMLEGEVDAEKRSALSGDAPLHQQPPNTAVKLHHRAVVVAQEPRGALGGLLRQLSLDQFENEGRRVSYGSPDSANALKKLLDRQASSRGLHKRIISHLLKPRGWKPPVRREYFMDYNDVAELCDTVQQIFAQEPNVLKLKAPIKIFGDLHGQFGDLMRLFDEYGFPSTAGDITYIDYLFLGDYVDRGQHSLEIITLLLALKVEYPEHIHLIRGNHEAADINALFGFRIECIERMGDRDGMWAWHRFNRLFNWLPLAALIEEKVICMHGGIGRSIHYIEQIENLPRPITMDAGSVVLMDLLWSDPTENDSIEGLRPNARGPGLVTFGPDRVMDFCDKNNLQMIIRAHECVMDGFERFAQGHLITLFSATNYCGTANNAGAILVLGRDLVIVTKLIHPIPPITTSPEASPDRYLEDTWMQELNVQRPPTPTRGRPHSSTDRGSLAWI